MDNLIQLEIIGRRTFKSHDIQETYHSNILVACPWDPRTLIYLFYLYFTVFTVDFIGCIILLLFEYSFYICYFSQLSFISVIFLNYLSLFIELTLFLLFLIIFYHSYHFYFLFSYFQYYQQDYCYWNIIFWAYIQQKSALFSWTSLSNSVILFFFWIYCLQANLIKIFFIVLIILFISEKSRNLFSLVHISIYWIGLSTGLSYTKMSRNSYIYLTSFLLLYLNTDSKLINIR